LLLACPTEDDLSLKPGERGAELGMNGEFEVATGREIGVGYPRHKEDLPL
jgi:hypothetical protein